MQLMPSLGEELHSELQEGIPYDPNRLYIAGYNAWLGSTELGRLHQRFSAAGIHPSLPMTIAGYNGGSEAVQRWVDGAESMEGDVWAENIGYTETRRYCRRVLGFLMQYRWVYGDPT
jgi:soluble lytic murein transglycosylase-like protein